MGALGPGPSLVGVIVGASTVRILGSVQYGILSERGMSAMYCAKCPSLVPSK